MLDKYAYSLDRSTNKARSTNTCLAYFGNVKNWLLDMYPQQGTIVKPLLQKVLSRLGKLCSNREDGAFERKTPPCSKQDLKKIVRLLYISPSATSIYLDASLVVMTWYLYGRSSDAEQLEKQQLSVLPGKSHQQLTSGLTFHSFRRGAAMHANDGTLAENWIFERGGWQLDRVNKAFGYMLGTTQVDQRVVRVLSGWSPKQGVRLPSLHALDPPIRDRARALQALLFAGTLGFADTALNLDETVSECLAATLIMHNLDILLLAESCTLVGRMHEIMAARSIGKAEVLAWSATIRRTFIPPPEASSPSDCSCDASAVQQLIKRQSEQIEVLILQNKRLEDRHLALEAQLRTQLALYEFRHAVGYMMLFLPTGLALDEASPMFKSETLNLGQKAEAKTLVFLKANGSSALAAGTALKALRKLHQDGKLDAQITQFHERAANGSIVDPTPASALPGFIRLQPNL
ncbi:unnamed protein product [Phytophthora fragariaefolia]|uniref:Unnamed protein product n=1 Tax=Phytophthora fragariaefolia TaxID=1490495 RepID=A0A9W6XRT2_9STRA|nr:unnamed protein product [Phytophthora fragariaefolia]